MIWDPQDWVHEFVQSFDFQFLDASLQDGGEEALLEVVRLIQRLEPQFPITQGVWGATQWRSVLETVQKTNLPIPVRRHLAHLCAEWVDWTSNHPYPAAKEWSSDLHALEGVLAGNLREDGTVRGQTVVNKGQKLGPNDPCPCGSGKKWKKCCGPNLRL
jgi:hypothetical protein